MRVTERDGDGVRTLGSLSSGNFFGEHALLSESPRRRATVTAETDVVCLILGKLCHF